MLVLTRREAEEVVIVVKGTAIRVGVIEQRGEIVRLGFEAPADVIIHRREVYERIDGMPIIGPPLTKSWKPITEPTGSDQ